VIVQDRVFQMQDKLHADCVRYIDVMGSTIRLVILMAGMIEIKHPKDFHSLGIAKKILEVIEGSEVAKLGRPRCTSSCSSDRTTTCVVGNSDKVTMTDCASRARYCFGRVTSGVTKFRSAYSKRPVDFLLRLRLARARWDWRLDKKWPSKGIRSRG
jgi:hypothetical protein